MTRALILAGAALAAAGAMHLLLRAAERWEAAGRGRSRDFVMLPALLVMAGLIAAVADRVDATTLRDGGFALFLGLTIGQAVPRPPRRKR